MKTTILAGGILLLLATLTFTDCVRKDVLPEEEGFTGWAVGDTADGYGTIIKTGDDGFHWSRLGSISNFPGVNLYGVSSLNADEVWVVGDTLREPGVNNTVYGLILMTSDGGYHWTRQTDTLLMQNVCFRTVNSRGDGKIWAGGNRGTLISSPDKGITWNRAIPDTMPDVVFVSVALKNPGLVWVIGNRYDQARQVLAPILLRSLDNGNNWQSIQTGLPGPLYDICTINDTILYMSSGNQVLVSHDAGDSWLPFYNSGTIPILTVAGDSLLAWAAGESEWIYKYSSGIWNPLQPQGNTCTLQHVNVSESIKVWVVGSCDAPYRKGVILYTRNAGLSWFIQESPANAPLHASSFIRGCR